MFEKLVTDLITRYLSKYVREIDERQMSIGLWGGCVELEDLELQSSALEELNLPLFVRAGTVGHLKISIPWSNLTNAKVSFELSDVFVIAEPIKPPDTAEDLEKCLQDRKQALLRKFERVEAERALRESLVTDAADLDGHANDDVDDVDDAAAESAKLKSSNPVAAFSKGGFLARTIAKLVDNFTVSVKNIHIRYEDSLTNQHNRFACGITLKSFQLVSAPNQSDLRKAAGLHGIAKTLDLDQFAVYWNTGEGPVEWSTREEFVQIMRQMETVSKSTSVEEDVDQNKPPILEPNTYILRPLSAHADLVVDTRNKDQGILIQANATLDLVDVGFSERQNRDLCAMLEYFSVFPSIVAARAQNFKLRPVGSTPAADPARWWRFAALAALQTGHRAANVEYLRNRRRSRLIYIRLWKSHLFLKAHRKEPDRAAEHEIAELERALLFTDIVLFRTLARIQLLKLFPQLFVPASHETGWWAKAKGWFIDSLNANDEAIEEMYAQLNEQNDEYIELMPHHQRRITQILNLSDDNLFTNENEQVLKKRTSHQPISKSKEFDMERKDENEPSTAKDTKNVEDDDDDDDEKKSFDPPEPRFQVLIQCAGLRATLYASPEFSHVVSVGEYDLRRGLQERKDAIVQVCVGELRIQSTLDAAATKVHLSLASVHVRDMSTNVNCFPMIVRPEPLPPAHVSGDYLEERFCEPEPLLPFKPLFHSELPAREEEEETHGYQIEDERNLLWVRFVLPREGHRGSPRLVVRLRRVYVTMNALLLQRIQLFFNNGNTLHASARADLAALVARRQAMRRRARASFHPGKHHAADPGAAEGEDASSAQREGRGGMSPAVRARRLAAAKRLTLLQRLAKTEFDVLIRGPTVAVPVRCDDEHSEALTLHFGVLAFRNVPHSPKAMLAPKYAHLRFDGERMVVAFMNPSPKGYWIIPERRPNVLTSRTSLAIHLGILKKEFECDELYSVEVTLEAKRLDFFGSLHKADVIFRIVGAYLPLLDTPVSEFHDVMLTQASVHAGKAPAAASASYPRKREFSGLSDNGGERKAEHAVGVACGADDKDHASTAEEAAADYAALGNNTNDVRISFLVHTAVLTLTAPTSVPVTIAPSMRASSQGERSKSHHRRSSRSAKGDHENPSSGSFRRSHRAQGSAYFREQPLAVAVLQGGSFKICVQDLQVQLMLTVRRVVVEDRMAKCSRANRFLLTSDSPAIQKALMAEDASVFEIGPPVGMRVPKDVLDSFTNTSSQSKREEGESANQKEEVEEGFQESDAVPLFKFSLIKYSMEKARFNRLEVRLDFAFHRLTVNFNRPTIAAMMDTAFSFVETVDEVLNDLHAYRIARDNARELLPGELPPETMTRLAGKDTEAYLVLRRKRPQDPRHETLSTPPEAAYPDLPVHVVVKITARIDALEVRLNEAGEKTLATVIFKNATGHFSKGPGVRTYIGRAGSVVLRQDMDLGGVSALPYYQQLVSASGNTVVDVSLRQYYRDDPYFSVKDPGYDTHLRLHLHSPRLVYSQRFNRAFMRYLDEFFDMLTVMESAGPSSNPPSSETSSATATLSSSEKPSQDAHDDDDDDDIEDSSLASSSGREKNSSTLASSEKPTEVKERIMQTEILLDGVTVLVPNELDSPHFVHVVLGELTFFNQIDKAQSSRVSLFRGEQLHFLNSVVAGASCYVEVCTLGAPPARAMSSNIPTPALRSLTLPERERRARGATMEEEAPHFKHGRSGYQVQRNMVAPALSFTVRLEELEQSEAAAAERSARFGAPQMRILVDIPQITGSFTERQLQFFLAVVKSYFADDEQAARERKQAEAEHAKALAEHGPSVRASRDWDDRSWDHQDEATDKKKKKKKKHHHEKKKKHHHGKKKKSSERHKDNNEFEFSTSELHEDVAAHFAWMEREGGIIIRAVKISLGNIAVSFHRPLTPGATPLAETPLNAKSGKEADPSSAASEMPAAAAVATAATTVSMAAGGKKEEEKESEFAIPAADAEPRVGAPRWDLSYAGSEPFVTLHLVELLVAYAQRAGGMTVDTWAEQIVVEDDRQGIDTEYRQVFGFDDSMVDPEDNELAADVDSDAAFLNPMRVERDQFAMDLGQLQQLQKRTRRRLHVHYASYPDGNSHCSIQADRPRAFMVPGIGMQLYDYLFNVIWVRLSEYLEEEEEEEMARVERQEKFREQWRQEKKDRQAKKSASLKKHSKKSEGAGREEKQKKKVSSRSKMQASTPDESASSIDTEKEENIVHGAAAETITTYVLLHGVTLCFPERLDLLGRTLVLETSIMFRYQGRDMGLRKESMLLLQNMELYKCQLSTPGTANQRVLGPLDLSLYWSQNRERTNVSVSLGEQPLDVKVAYGDGLLALALARGFGYANPPPRGADPDRPNPMPVATHDPPPPAPAVSPLFQERVHVITGGLRVTVLDDQYELDAPLLDLAIEDVQADLYNWSRVGAKMEFGISLVARADLYNSRRGGWEPLVEPWRVVMRGSKDQLPGDSTHMQLNCGQLLINFTQDGMSSVKALVDSWTMQHAVAHMEQGEEELQKQMASENTRAPILLRNCTHLPLRYWCMSRQDSSPAGLGEVERESEWAASRKAVIVAPGATVPLRLSKKLHDELAQSGGGLDTSQSFSDVLTGDGVDDGNPTTSPSHGDSLQNRASAETKIGSGLCIQLKGGWEPLKGLPIHVHGSWVLPLHPAPLHVAPLSVVYSVSSEHGKKIVSVKSCIEVCNHTDSAIEVRFTMSDHRLPFCVQVEPGATMSVPLPYCTHGIMRIRPAGMGNQMSVEGPEVEEGVTVLPVDKGGTSLQAGCHPLPAAETPHTGGSSGVSGTGSEEILSRVEGWCDRPILMKELVNYENENGFQTTCFDTKTTLASDTPAATAAAAAVAAVEGDGKVKASSSNKTGKTQYTSYWIVTRSKLGSQCGEDRRRRRKGVFQVPPMRAIHVHAPAHIRNLLCVPLLYRVRNDQREIIAEGTLPCGESRSLYRVNSRGTMQICLRMMHSEGWSRVSTLGGGSHDEIILATPNSYGAPTIHISVRNVFEDGSRTVVIYTPYWMVNRTGLPLLYRPKTKLGGAGTISDVGDKSTGSDIKGNSTFKPEGKGKEEKTNGSFLGSHGAAEVGPLESNIHASDHYEDFPIEPREWYLSRGGRRLARPTLYAYPPQKLDPFSKKTSVRLTASRWSKAISLESVGMTGQLEVSERRRSVFRKGEQRLFSLGVSIELAPAPFQRTKIVTFTPRYILVNEMKDRLYYRQVSSSSGFDPSQAEENTGNKLQGTAEKDAGYMDGTYLQHGERLPWHWRDGKGKRHSRYLSISLGGDWSWSGGFPLSDIAHFAVKLENAKTGKCVFVSVETQLTGSSYYCSFTKIPHEQAPYKLQNNSNFELKVAQKRADGRAPSRLVVIPAHQILEYAWLQPTGPHRLIIDCAALSLRKDLNLDKIKTYYWIRNAGSRNGSWTKDPKAVSRLIKEDVETSRHAHIQCFMFRVKVDGASRVLQVVDLVLFPEEFYGDAGAAAMGASLDRGAVFHFEAVMERGIGLSLIDSTPREILFLCVEGVRLEAEIDNMDSTLEFTVKHFQIDDQRVGAIFPVVLSPRKGTQNFAFHLSINKSSQHEKIDYFRYFSALVQEMDLLLDEEFVDAVLRFMDVSVETMAGSIRDQNESMRALLGDPDQVVSSGEGSSHQDAFGGLHVPQRSSDFRKLYVELFLLNPIKINVTFHPNPSAEGGALRKIIGSVGVSLAVVEGASISLNALLLQHPYLQRREFFSRIGNHYYRQAIQQLYKMLGSSAILGQPVNFVNTLGQSVHEFVALPAAGIVQSPREFGIGLRRGTTGLLKGTVTAVFSSLGSVSSAVGRGLASVSMDRHHAAGRPGTQQPRHVGEGIASGVQALGRGVFNGLTGVVVDPVMGARRGGMSAAVRGIGSGLAGVVARPLAGVVGFVNQTSQGLVNTVHMFDAQRQRVREPRHFESNLVVPYSEAKALAQTLLWSLIDTNGQGEYLFHVPLTSRTILLVSTRSIASVDLRRGGPHVNFKIPLLGVRRVESIGCSVQIEFNPRQSRFVRLLPGAAAGAVPGNVSSHTLSVTNESLARWLVHELRSVVNSMFGSLSEYK